MLQLQGFVIDSEEKHNVLKMKQSHLGLSTHNFIAYLLLFHFFGQWGSYGD